MIVNKLAHPAFSLLARTT